MRHFFNILFFCSISFYPYAQDLIFNQHNHATLAINPAFTGDFEGDLRINTIYRNRGQNIFQNHSNGTAFFSIDSKYEISNGTKLGYGLTGLHDASALSRFVDNGIGFNGSLTKTIGNENYGYNELSLGVNNGVVFRKDPGRSDRMFWDLTIGGFYRYYAKEGWIFELGGTIFHSNKSLPESFQSDLDKRYTIYVRGQFAILSKLSLLPTILYNSQNSWERVLVGSTLRYKLGNFNENAIYVDFGYHYLGGEHFINIGHGIRGTIGFNNFRVGFLYDFYPNINVQTNRQSAFELSFAYIFNRARS